MSKYSNQIKKILKAINNVGKFNYLVGIDGCSGAGKTTLASELVNNLQDVYVVHMDDFYKQKALRIEAAMSKEIGSFFDWQRLKKQVLTPFTLTEEINYQKYDWEHDVLGEWVSIPVNSSIIVEGVYTIRKELSKYYDLKIWVEATSETRLRRGLERDGIERKEYWEKVWAVQEDRYVKVQKPHLYAHLIVDGNGR